MGGGVNEAMVEMMEYACMGQKNFDGGEFRLIILPSLDKNFCHPLWGEYQAKSLNKKIHRHHYHHHFVVETFTPAFQSKRHEAEH